MWLVYLHVATMFIAFALTAGVGFFSSQVLRTRDVRTIRSVVPYANALTGVGGALLLIGVLFGIGAAAQFGISLTARWLVITYVLVAYIIIDGVFAQRPARQRIAIAAQASAEDRPSEELNRLLDNKRETVGGIISGLAYLAIIFLMIIKP